MNIDFNMPGMSKLLFSYQQILTLLQYFSESKSKSNELNKLYGGNIHYGK
jgi:hypothetical protein